MLAVEPMTMNKKTLALILAFVAVFMYASIFIKLS
jgi:hypothetical protein